MDRQPTSFEIKFYLLGIIGLTLGMLFTIYNAGLFTPLRLLQLRLFLVSAAFVYFLVIYFYQERSAKNQLENIDVHQNKVVICFNGKKVSKNNLK